MPTNITLTADQKAAVKAFLRFLTDDQEKYLVIHGAAGTGKSTLITYLMEALERHYKMYALLLCKQPKNGEFEVQLAATTNKAVSVMKDLTGRPAATINSLLSVRPQPNFKTGHVDLVKTYNYDLLYNKLIILDEASMLSDDLFKVLDDTTIDCKIVLIGDQYQLAPVKQKESLMSSLACPKAEMNEIIRHDGDILQTSALFREVVETGEFKDIPVSQNVLHVSGPDFKALIDSAFTHPTYQDGKIKILAWSNNRVCEYNDYIRKLKGYPEHFESGETVITNNFIHIGKAVWPVDSLIKITNMYPTIGAYDVPGYQVELDRKAGGFLPNDQRDTKAVLKALKREKNWKEFYTVQQTWLDLRPVYSSTVHKSQGSTYDTVFIDLSDIGRCNIASDVARMLYVSISRASKQVVLYGVLPHKYQEPVEEMAAV